MILSVFALTVMTTVSFAQTAPQQTAPPADAAPVAQAAPQAAQEKKIQVDEKSLPDAVKSAIATDEFKEWKLVSGWHVEGAAPYYLLEMQKGEERKTVKLDTTGKTL